MNASPTYLGSVRIETLVRHSAPISPISEPSRPKDERRLAGRDDLPGLPRGFLCLLGRLMRLRARRPGHPQRARWPCRDGARGGAWAHIVYSTPCGVARHPPKGELYGDAALAYRHSPVPSAERGRSGQPSSRGRGARAGGRARTAPTRSAVSGNRALRIFRGGRGSRDGAHRGRARRPAWRPRISGPPIDAIIGFYEKHDGNLQNSVAYLRCGSGAEILHVHRKTFLPTYGIFDEERFVERGYGIRAFDAPWGRAAMLCAKTHGIRSRG